MFARESHIAVRTFLFVLLSFFLMVLDWRMGARTHLRAVLSVPLAGVQYMVSLPIQLFQNVSDGLKTHVSLVRENRALRSDQLLLKAEVQRLTTVENENEKLRELLHASSHVRGKVLVAQLLSIDSDPFVHQVTLNRGRRDGVYVGQTVLDAYGVLGQVIEVNPLTSQILLVDDPRSGVPVQVLRNGARAIAMGDAASGRLRLVNVPQTADIQTGDMLITSGLGANYPSGYPLGRVHSVTRDPGLQFATILVDPIAHLDRGSQVLLVWPAPPAKEEVTG